ncbi:uncharacterized protein LOC110845019 [Folsomia candida]|uniref:Uncharacterized protein n=1 Tax=Folsomia candida TaxID=158441 RepID=A0A226EUV7_FOLCA|nr:uncharacterized protein LOC110845019 [Folsomia candida]OXA60591.1 hypothetical protein Fcan01_04993 [Folsomia candida]
MAIIKGNPKLLIILSSLVFILAGIHAQLQNETSSFESAPQRQLEDEDDETTTIPPVTVSPEQIYTNLNTALNVTSGIVQDIICRIPFLRLCEGASGLKLPTYPIPPSTMPTTPRPQPTTPARVVVG